MFERAKDVIDDVAKETDSVILFHSMSGKDSIALLDLLYPKFKRVVCVFMYIVKDLEHIEVYRRWAKARYPNAEFMDIPHYALYSYIRSGHMGIRKNPKQKQWTLSDITEKVRELTGIEWVCCGFKQSDGLNRRLMLRSYGGVTGTDSSGAERNGKEAIQWKTKKFYPLSTYYNRDILDYIQENGLKNPEVYGVAQSNGTDITDPGYMRYLRARYPGDLEKIYAVFPLARIVLLDDENKRNKDNQEESDTSESI